MAEPAVVERGDQSHIDLQNLLADYVASAGLAPRSPLANNPLCDLLWKIGDLVWVCEVKSLTTRNEERQLRQGLGQLLRYRHQLEVVAQPVRGVLMVEYEPADPQWQSLSESLGIVLAWPDSMGERLPFA
jgi:hypothetical protein